MSRYTDADELKKTIDIEIFRYDTIDHVFQIIDNAPSIDIVRCGECKYCVNGQCWKSDGLDKLAGNVADDDFCSRGEREGER